MWNIWNAKVKKAIEYILYVRAKTIDEAFYLNMLAHMSWPPVAIAFPPNDIVMLILIVHSISLYAYCNEREAKKIVSHE